MNDGGDDYDDGMKKDDDDTGDIDGNGYGDGDDHVCCVISMLMDILLGMRT